MHWHKTHKRLLTELGEVPLPKGKIHPLPLPTFYCMKNVVKKFLFLYEQNLNQCSVG